VNKKLGDGTSRFADPPRIVSAASVVGPKEAEGPLGGSFDAEIEDEMFGQETWERAESAFTRRGIKLAAEKAGMEIGGADFIIGGDLLNQSIGTTFGARGLTRPLIGIYGACSTFGEGLGLGAMMIDGGFAGRVIVGASSHFCAAERQFRFPLSMGTQRPPTSTWTVTGHGAAVLASEGDGFPRITHFTAGVITDYGVTDANNMGGAMAPAAWDVIARHLRDTGRAPDYYDAIVTGDLGSVGSSLLLDLARGDGADLTGAHADCGVMIYDPEKQDTHAGGSGCACSAATFAAVFYPKLRTRKLNRLLFVPTGAMLSATSVQQGESIPCVAYAVAIENL
jgi:stage V sporulation protein AD